MSKLRIDVWSDLACPWCYVGKRRLEQALARFSHAADVELVWRAFELDPAAPRIRDATQTYAERIGAKYRMAPAQAQVMIDRMVATAATDGLALRFDRIRPGNTFDAHRLLHLAHERGVQDALKERLFRAYFTEGQAIGDPEALVPLAREVGLDDAEVRTVLATDRYATEVRGDEELAEELGISGVPFFLLGGQLGVSGAHPADVLLDALERAWSVHRTPEVYAEGAVCGPLCGPLA